jgi:hypothetical protein
VSPFPCRGSSHIFDITAAPKYICRRLSVEQGMAGFEKQNITHPTGVAKVFEHLIQPIHDVSVVDLPLRQ